MKTVKESLSGMKTRAQRRAFVVALISAEYTVDGEHPWAWLLATSDATTVAGIFGAAPDLTSRALAVLRATRWDRMHQLADEVQRLIAHRQACAARSVMEAVRAAR